MGSLSCCERHLLLVVQTKQGHGRRRVTLPLFTWPPSTELTCPVADSHTGIRTSVSKLSSWTRDQQFPPGNYQLLPPQLRASRCETILPTGALSLKDQETTGFSALRSTAVTILNLIQCVCVCVTYIVLPHECHPSKRTRTDIPLL